MEVRKILVPIDGSDASERAFSYALSLAKKTDAKIIMTYIIDADILIYPVYRVSLADVDSETIRKKGEDTLNLLTHDLPEGIEVEKIVKVGVPGRAIVRIAEDEGADLIIMGNSGKGSISSFVMGSVSHYTVQHSKCPVLIVK